MKSSDGSLKALAAKYIWWKSVDEALAYPDALIAHVMNIGDYADVQTLIASVDEERLRDVISHEEAGQFNERSWAYWHYRLDLAPALAVPPMPKRIS